MWGGREEKRRVKIKPDSKIYWDSGTKCSKGICTKTVVIDHRVVLFLKSHKNCEMTSRRSEKLQFQGRAVFSRNYI